MNYYPRHIGDYVSATAHLSMIEDGAYTRLLDWYYQDERPLPSDKRLIYRRIRATSRSERQAVDAVLGEFFTPSPDGFRHARCDEEIAAAQEKTAETDAKKENERERQARHRQRRKELFDALRGYGQVPAWDTATSDLEAMLSRAIERAGNGPVTRDNNGPVTRTATANQEPIANSQEPIAKESERESTPRPSRPRTRPRTALALTELPQEWEAYCRRERPDLHAPSVFARFRDWHQAQGSLMADWSAAWRTWIGKERGPSREPTPAESRNAAFAREWGFGNPTPDPGVIDMEDIANGETESERPGRG